MKMILLASTLCLLTACGGRESSKQFISGAKTKITIGDGLSPAPLSTLALLKNDEPHCSAVLIHMRFALTAAHCFQESTDPGDYTVGLGEIQPFSKRSSLKGTKFFVEKNGRPNLKYLPQADIALIELASELPGAMPIPILMNPEKKLTSKEPLLLAGFGKTSFRADPDEELKLRATETELDRLLTRGIFRGLFTFRSDGKQSACSGDSGGPAYVFYENKWQLLGLTQGALPALNPDVEFAEDPCLIGSGTYTLVSSYLDWIASNVPDLDLNVPLPGTRAQEDSLLEYCESPYLSLEEAYTLRAIMGHTSNRARSCESLAHSAADIEKIALSRAGLQDIKVLSFFSNLRDLQLADNEINDAKSLEKLNYLRSLDLRGNALGDLPHLGDLQNLEVLKLSNQKVKQDRSLDTLGHLTALRVAELDGLGLSTLPDLSVLKKLKNLSLVSNKLSDLAFLAETLSLVTLRVDRNQIESLTSLAKLQALRQVYFTRNQVNTLDGLRELKSLDFFVGFGNPLPIAEKVCFLPETFEGEKCQF